MILKNKKSAMGGTGLVVVPFIFRILVRYETLITRAQGPVVVMAKNEI